MSCCSSKQHVQQIGVAANNPDSTSRKVIGLQKVDYLNCTKTVLFSLISECMQISNTAEPSALHLLALCAYQYIKLFPKENIFTLRNDHCNRKYTIKAIPFAFTFSKVIGASVTIRCEAGWSTSRVMGLTHFHRHNCFCSYWHTTSNVASVIILVSSWSY